MGKDKRLAQTKLLRCSVTIAVISLILMVITILYYTDKDNRNFVIPEFEVNAIQGTPEITDKLKELGYTEFYQDGMSYKFSLCGKTLIKDKKATVYLTNDKLNEKWLKIRLISSNGEILGESGIIKPGEYVEHVNLKRVAKSGDKITLKIMGYEPEVYTSAGSVSVSTVIN